MSNSTGPVVHTTENEVSHSEVGLPRKKKNSRQEQVERLKRALLQARSLIVEELSPVGSSLNDTPADVGADILDRSANDLERTLCLLLRERGRNKLKAIDDALERIQDGTFGFCEECGEKIPAGRLDVMPFATTCRDCKSLQEKREKLLSSESEPPFPYE